MGLTSSPNPASSKSTCAVETVTTAVTAPVQVGTGSVKIKSLKALNMYECAGLYVQAFAGATAPAAGATPVDCWFMQAGVPGVNAQNEASFFVDDGVAQVCHTDGLFIAISETPNVYTVPGTNLDNGVNPLIPAAPVDANVIVKVEYAPC